MHLNVCKSCGGETVRQGNCYVCKYCGNRWVIDAADDVHVVDRANAWAALRDCDFEKSAELFENIIYKDPKGHEAYWGRALANAGIMYVTDYHENKKVPTCNSISEISFLDSTDVKKAISLAPADVAEVYRRQAMQIENIRVEWVKKASQEPPYDVFICFKDSDRENGIERTPDSYDAQELYSLLTDEGYKVFFSRVSLRGKISEHYEPYIYNALRTAKVMIVFGEKPEYFNAVWVKNEWIRFRAMVERGEKDPHSLVVVYKNMAPADLPVGLRSRQCLCETELTFLEDLKKHIAKIVRPESARPAAPSTATYVLEPTPAPAVAPAPKVKKKKKGGVLAAVLITLAVCLGLIWAVPNVVYQVLMGPEETQIVNVGNNGLGFDNVIIQTVPKNEAPEEDNDGDYDYFNPSIGVGGNGGFEVIEPDVDIDGDGSFGNGNQDGADNIVEGLRVYFNDDMQAYVVEGIAERRPEYVIPSYYNGMPIAGIDMGVFMECVDLMRVELPDTLTYIADNVFKGCTSLQVIDIPDGVMHIGQEAFYGCTSLTSVFIGDGLIEIGDNVFGGCTSLELFSVSSSNRAFTDIDGVLFNKAEVLLINYPIGRGDELYSVPVGVSYIGEYAFSGCKNLKFVVLGEGLLNIGEGAFENCTSLAGLAIPGTLTAIDYNAFNNCPIEAASFAGSTAQWVMIAKGRGNEALTKAEIIFEDQY